MRFKEGMTLTSVNRKHKIVVSHESIKLFDVDSNHIRVFSYCHSIRNFNASDDKAHTNIQFNDSISDNGHYLLTDFIRLIENIE